MKQPHRDRRTDQHGLHQTAGLSIEKFSKVKSANVDKQRLVQRHRLVRIKRSKQYNKVKQRLILEGKYPEQPDIATAAEPGQDGDEQHAQPPHTERAASAKEASSSGHRAAGEPTSSKHGWQHTGAAQPADEPLPPTGAGQQQPGRKPKKQKHKSALQALAEKQAKEKEELRQRQEEARRAAQQRQAALRAVERKRKKQTVKLFKKTKKGQPIMKYRLEKILDTLTKG